LPESLGKCNSLQRSCPNYPGKMPIEVAGESEKPESVFSIGAGKNIAK
jgi:hypothetical protein